jgi:hypothetical protein
MSAVEKNKPKRAQSLKSNSGGLNLKCALTEVHSVFAINYENSLHGATNNFGSRPFT